MYDYKGIDWGRFLGVMALLGNLTVLVDGHIYIPAKMTQNSTLMCQCQLPGFDFILYCVKCHLYRKLKKEMKSFCTIFATYCDFTIIPKFKNLKKCLGTQRNCYNQSAILMLFVSIRHGEENVPAGSILTNSVLLLCSLSTFKCKHISFIFIQQNPTLWKTITTIKWRPWRLYGLLLERINVYLCECNFHQNFELDLQNPVYFKFAFDAMGYHKKISLTICSICEYNVTLICLTFVNCCFNLQSSLTRFVSEASIWEELVHFLPLSMREVLKILMSQNLLCF